MASGASERVASAHSSKAGCVNVLIAKCAGDSGRFLRSANSAGKNFSPDVERNELSIDALARSPGTIRRPPPDLTLATSLSPSLCVRKGGLAKIITGYLSRSAVKASSSVTRSGLIGKAESDSFAGSPGLTGLRARRMNSAAPSIVFLDGAPSIIMTGSASTMSITRVCELSAARSSSQVISHESKDRPGFLKRCSKVTVSDPPGGSSLMKVSLATVSPSTDKETTAGWIGMSPPLTIFTPILTGLPTPWDE